MDLTNPTLVSRVGGSTYMLELNLTYVPFFFISFLYNFSSYFLCIFYHVINHISFFFLRISLGADEVLLNYNFWVVSDKISSYTITFSIFLVSFLRKIIFLKLKDIKNIISIVRTSLDCQRPKNIMSIV